MATLRIPYTPEYVFRGVRYTGETIAKQMKPATALKGTILQKTDQRCTFIIKLDK